ncbi:diaminopimelate epimerase [Nereida sp. NH-UV-3]|uniref:diaminopimelate epimerase n=1 Tax=Nereida TaxID=282198 RepID=UPI0036F3565B
MTKNTDHMPVNFMKMHGAGNDFVVIDSRNGGPVVSAKLVAAIADRNRGVGFDQLAVIEDGLRLTFYNSDGSTSGACGNATRCIAAREMAMTGMTELPLQTDRGALRAVMVEGETWINMSQPQLEWHDVPLAEPLDTLSLPIDGSPAATGMGNPHCTFFVDDAEAIDLASFGHKHEHHPLYPERTNVQVVHVLGPDHLRMRVWERGAGITLASGSSSCATAVAAHRRGLTGRKVRIDLDGGTLVIDWRDDGVWMTGPTAHVFDGVLTPDWLAGL